jgi:hypothetical protein
MRRSTGFFRSAVFVFGLLLGAAADRRAASADQSVGLVQITCVPEAGYFSIRRFVFVNPPRQPGADLQPLLSTIASKDRIYTASRLKAEPAECELLGTNTPSQADQRRRLGVRVQGFYDDQNGQAVGARQIVENVEVSAGGKPLGRLRLNAFGYSPDEIDLIEVRFDGGNFWVDRCSYYPSHDPKATKGCAREMF